jgi:hypothetical protein|nr:MAG TPA: hypothetical protein [Caudoviricetes sp.]
MKMYKNNFYISSSDTITRHSGVPRWKNNTWDKSLWENNGSYWNVWSNTVGNTTYWYIQYGYDDRPFASVKFQYFNTEIVDFREDENHVITFDVKYRFTFLCNRACTTNNGGTNVHNQYYIKDKLIYDLNYNTATNNTWDTESDPYYYRYSYRLEPQQALNVDELIKATYDYKGVFPNVTLYIGNRIENDFLPLYYPGYIRKNLIKIDTGYIKNRLATLKKDDRRYQNQVNKGNFRYRKNNNNYQINEYKGEFL